MGNKGNQAEQWLKTIDIWDEQYDYVMHNDHWLTSEWCPNCDKCLAKSQKSVHILVDLNETFDLYKSALAETPTINRNNKSIHNDDKAKMTRIPVRAPRYQDLI